ncbi:MAG TPA: class I mannose-6-phosphate isomerase [Candidatus Latescibacteria bacterium]|nr:class I mannose-6-phosphate isomerase [Candidatus Latescibacterota bacterium]
MRRPLKLRPILKEKIWGGRNLEKVLGRKLPPEVKVGESWEVSEHMDDVSVVCEGPLSGRDLRELIRSYGGSLLGSLGRELFPDRFPLLVKFVDAGERLSVQVHPDDGYALGNEGDLGKTEAWYVVWAEPGAELVLGFSRDTSPDEVRRSLDEGTVEELLKWVPVSEGDVIFLSPGTLHALGEGILVYEVQESSDVTYRLYDWGRGREVHIDKALDVLNYGPVDLPKARGLTLEEAGGYRTFLVACRYFALERLEVFSEMAGECDGRSFHALSLIEGEGLLVCGEGSLEVHKGETLLLPADLGGYRLEGRLVALLSFVPDVVQDVVVPLREAGYGKYEIGSVVREGTCS